MLEAVVQSSAIETYPISRKILKVRLCNSDDVLQAVSGLHTCSQSQVAGEEIPTVA